jgi:biotin carboxylase
MHALGHKVYLVTSEKTKVNDWPRESIEEIFYMPGTDGRLWNIQDLIAGTAHIFRMNYVDKIIALDDYDVWKAATLREEFRSPGMGQTTARHFFDKLAMRMQAKEKGIRVPGFSALFNDEKINAFLNSSKGPWVVKPRSDAGALGIRKLHSIEDFWAWNAEHFEKRHSFLIEEFKPGAVYHVDSLFQDYKSLFTRSSRYLQPPFEVAHGGGIFRSQTIDDKDPESNELEQFNNKLLKAFGLNYGASHSEFIKCHEDGEFYFLETSARVGGAHLADMVHAASGVNLWSEWAKLESAMIRKEEYKVPKAEKNNAGIVATLSRYEWPDYSVFNDPAIWWKMNKKHHFGLILKDKSMDVIKEKLDHYTEVIFRDYHASVTLKE